MQATTPETSNAVVLGEPSEPLTYPGSDRFDATQLAIAGSKPIDLGAEPLIRASDIAYMRFQVPDLERQKTFLLDFGMHVAHQDENALYMRGTGKSPFLYVAELGKTPAFLGSGFVVEEQADLEKLARNTGTTIEPVDAPGGGHRIRLVDPDGFTVDVIQGRKEARPMLTRRVALPTNGPIEKKRVNQGQRTSFEPTPVERLGHFVLLVSDFEASWAWYRRHLGVLPSDVLCAENGSPIMAFTRLDLGNQPADHHTLMIAQGLRPQFMHSAYEAVDQDAVGQGQQFLKSRKWRHAWGMGRHILGSQIFDYWFDPYGFEIEHYSDGDVFDASYPTQYHLADRANLWAWGDDLPKHMNAKVSLKDVWALLRKKMRGEDLSRIFGAKRAMEYPARPWIKW